MSGEVGYARRNAKIHDFYSPLDRSLFLVGLQESWLARSSRCGRCPHAHEMLEDVEVVGGWRAAACPPAYEAGDCELTEARLGQLGGLARRPPSQLGGPPMTS